MSEEKIKYQENLEQKEDDEADEPKTDEPGRDETDETDEPETGTGTEEESLKEEGRDKKVPKRKSGFRKRIDKLTRQKKELQEQLEKMKAELERLKGPIEDPKEEDFESYEEYIKALTRAELQRARAQQLEEDTGRLEKRAVELNEHELQAKREIIDAIIEEGIKKQPDYIQVVFSNPFLPEHLADAIMNLNNADEVFYHLGKNPLESKRLASLPADKLPGELSKLESEVSLKEPAAPPPLEPVEGGEGINEELADDLPIDEWMKRRDRQLRGT